MVCEYFSPFCRLILVCWLFPLLCQKLFSFSLNLFIFIFEKIFNYLIMISNIDAMLCYAKSLQSCPTLCDPIDGSHQAPLSLGFSRQEHWSGLPFLSPMHESKKWKQSRSVVSDSVRPIDGSPPGSPVPGILQARTLEWVAISFSNARKWNLLICRANIPKWC